MRGIIFVILLFNLSALDQGHYKTLVIDTLIDPGNHFGINCSDLKSTFYPMELEDKLIHKDFTKHPNLITSLPIYDDDQKFQISIDNEDGILELFLPDSNSIDTIRISKLKLLRNPFYDTIFHDRVEWIDSDSGIVQPPIKTSHKFKVIKKGKNKISHLDHIQIHINSKMYLVQLESKRSYAGQVTHYHGYKPKKYRDDRENYKGKKKIKIWGSIIENKYSYYGKLELTE